MKINFNVNLKNNQDTNNHSIIISELTSHEMDKIRILLKTICDYGQFKDAEVLSEQLSLNKLFDKKFFSQIVKK